MGSRSVWFRLWVLGGMLAGLTASLRADAPEKRLALVIGNAGYASGALPNCRNDAADMAAALRTLGFTVTQTVDQDRRQMTEAVRAVAARCDSDTLALVYFSGHGVQVDGKNYLIPVRAEIGKESDVEFEALQAKWVLQQLEERKPKASLLILDACRDNPLPASAKSTAKGLIPIKTRKGSLVAFAADEGETASANDSGRDSLYTQELLRNLTTPGLKILDIFVKTRAAVATKSGDRQNPREDNGLVDNFVLAPDPLAVDSSGHRVGEISVNPIDGAEMVWVPPGEFPMGSEDGEANEKPVHRVRLTRGYWLYKTPVTNAQYGKFLDANPQHEKPAFWNDPSFNQSQQPVVGVNWQDALDYCARAKAALPTEAQWEYAARGPQGRTYPWGEEFPDPSRAVFRLDAEKGRPEAVGIRPAGKSWCGAQDMAGNVWQWCADRCDLRPYPEGPATDPSGIANGSFRIMRGGSWGTDFNLVRGASRGGAAPDNRNRSFGFRCVQIGF